MPKIVDKDKRRQEIAQAALTLFAEEGFTVPLNRVAEVVGLTKGSLYVYFESREELIQTSLKQWAKKIMDYPIQELMEIPDPAERFRRYCHLATDNFLNDPLSIKIAVATVHLLLTRDRLSQERDIFKEYLDDFRQVSTAIIEDGVVQGIFKPDTVKISHKLSINLFAFLDGLALHYWMQPDFDLREQIDLFVDQMLTHLSPSNQEAL